MPSAESSQMIGAPVEGFQLHSLDGESFALNRILTGKKGAVVMFWSSTCSHCIHYDGFLNRFAAKHPELGLAVIASRDGERLNQLKAVAKERRLNFPILHDADGKVAAAWCVRQTPRAFLINSDTVLLYRGAVDNYRYPGDPEHVSYLEPAITDYLAGRPLSRVEVASFGCAVNSVYYKLPKAL